MTFGFGLIKKFSLKSVQRVKKYFSFRRKKGEFIISEVEEISTGEKTSRILTIVRNLKNKFNQVRPVILGMIVCTTKMIIINFAFNLALEGTFYLFNMSWHVFRVWQTHSNVNLYVGKNLLSCGLPSICNHRDQVLERVRRFNKLAEPRVAPTFNGGSPYDCAQQRLMQLMEPQVLRPSLAVQMKVYHNQYTERIAEKLYAFRGGWTYQGVLLVITQMGVSAVINSCLSSFGVVGLSGYILRFGASSLMDTILSAGLNSIVSSAFSVGPKINPNNIASTVEEISKLKIPATGRSNELFGVKVNNTNVILAVSSSQIAKKLINHSTVFGTENITALGHSILTYPNAGTLYKATFGSNYVNRLPVENAIVSLITNETIIDKSLVNQTLVNLSTIFIYKVEGAILNANITLGLNQTAATAASNCGLGNLKVCVLRTWYILKNSQVVKLIEKKLIQ